MKLLATGAVALLLLCSTSVSGAQHRLPVSAPATAAAEPGFRTALLPAAAVQAGTPDVQSGNPRVPIDWASAQADARTQIGTHMIANVSPVPVRPDNAGVEDLNRVTLPLLLPASAVADLSGESTRLYSRAHFYTASITGDAMVIEVFGTRLRQAMPPDAEAQQRLAGVRNEEGFVVSRGDGSWIVSFNRYGAAYSVTVECGDPADARCADDSYALRIANALLIVGGQPEAP